jgi:hypothetical protein
MGYLVWTNNSSVTVDWFIITALGTATDTLAPGEEYRVETSPEILQVGMRCGTAAVYIIDDQNPAPGIDNHLVASDIIPTGGRTGA